jgi:Zn-dependent protease with chaperone function
VAAPVLSRASPPRLDPFALPVATTSRFLLLIVLSLAAGATTYDVLVPGDWAQLQAGCTAAARAAEGDPTAAVAFNDCLDAVGRLRVLAAAAGSAAVALALLVGWLLYPVLIRHRQGLVRLDERAHPRATAEIRAVLAGTPLPRRPDLLIDPFRAGVGGRAFGRWPRYTVRLSLGTLRAAEAGDPVPLRAVLRHELAHLRNRDVDLTALTVVAWWALLLIAAVPQVVGVVATAPDQLWPLVGRLAVVLVAALLLRASVLRSRELYADVRASVGLPPGEPLFHRQSFPDPPARPAPGWWRQAVRPVQGWARLHPSAAQRDRVVHAPQALMRARAGEALATGITAGIVLTDVRNLTVSYTGQARFGAVLAGLLLGALVAAVVGTALWRETLQALVRRTPLPSGTAPALGLAAGISLGQLASPQQSLSALGSAAATDPGLAAVAVLVLVGLCVGFARWVVAGAAAWLSHSTSPNLTRPMRIGQLVTALVAGAGLATWSLLASSIGEGAEPLSVASVPVTTLVEVNGLGPILLGVAYPLTAGILTVHRATSRTLTLDVEAATTLPRPRHRMLLITVPGLLLATVGLVVDRLLPSGLAFGAFTGLGFGTD